ncbi:hypothetical protein SDRG_12930 [Saprolegnia diclina VS20]|uniref:Anaphase-promoting complex subunit 4 WD40 domain-containing protein n=1 Tax=Saprolegnia diclina (strain VS20) TaxID=1156394 RepID=T0RHH5_SAPDV|nr:hypothetical protein SDRG_12930 [Saprolegnia diclina VS20]EQC29262.1 hypothetical protein SDRG_12930 [Saprolegnia diclina VS20]|eukprot:XP_008617236.1 hypothetical protein SDRG_12930 [Saprolegnia diclina VS20]
MASVVMELEHAIGFSGIPAGLHFHPNGAEYVYPAGGCIVIASLSDPHNQVFLRGHDGNISALAMSPTGGLLASGQYGSNSDVLVWDYAARRLLHRFSEHDFGINGVAFSHDERLLCTVGAERDGRIFIWDLETGNIVTTQQKLQMNVLAVTWGGFHRDVKRRDTTSYLFATGGARMLTFWVLNPASGELAPAKVEFGAPVVRDYTCVQFTPDRETLVAGTTSGDFAVVNVKTRRFLHSISACTCGVSSIVALDAGVLVGGGNGDVLYFNHDYVDSAKVALVGPVSGLSLAASTVGRPTLELLAGTQHGNMYHVKFTAASGQLTSALLCENHFRGVLAVAFATESDRFATLASDCTVRIWDASDYSVVVAASVHDAGMPHCLAYSLDILLTGWSDGCIRCHGSDNGDFLWSIDNAHTGGVTALALSNNQRFIVSGGAGGDVRVWDLRKRDMVSHLKEHSMTVSGLALFDDDVHLLSCSRDKSFLCWELRSERRISSHIQRMGGLNAVALSRNQSIVLTVGQEKRISFWDLRIETPINIITKAHVDEATCIAVAHALPLFATGGTDQVVKLWSFDTGALLVDGIGHSGSVRSLAFSPDDRQLVTVGDEGGIFVWNIYTDGVGC